MMCAYFIYTGLALPEIATAVTTCFFVSLGSLGESIQKLTLRIAGALVGGVAAGLCIAFVRPSMTDIGQLVLLVGVATGICAWVSASSVRLSYAGLHDGVCVLARLSAELRAALALQGSVLPRRRDSPRKRACHRRSSAPCGRRAQRTARRAAWTARSTSSQGSSAPGRRRSVPGSRCSSRSTRRASSMPLRSSSCGMIPKEPSAEAETGNVGARARESRRAHLRRGRVAGSPAIADRLRSENERAGRLASCSGAPDETVRPRRYRAAPRGGRQWKAHRLPIAPPSKPTRCCCPSSRRSMASRRRLSFAAPWQAVLGTLIVAQPACATRELERAPATS